MRFKDYSITQVLIGLQRIGIVGLSDALKNAAASGIQDREGVTDLLMEALRAKNFIPPTRSEAYRTVLWREYLRHTGQAFSAFYSEAPVTVRGEPGEDRERFVDLLEDVLADFELKPVITFGSGDDDGPTPQLSIDGETIIRGMPTRRALKAAVHRSFSDW